MANSARLTVGTTPVLLYAAQLEAPETVILAVESGADVTLGGPAVVAGQGPPIKLAGAAMVLPMAGDTIYGVSGSTAVVDVLAVKSSPGF
jgi:hypothetical protein